MGPDLSSCNLFVDDCAVKYTFEQLFQMLVTTDASGCPVLKTQEQSAGVVSSQATPQTFSNATIAGLGVDIANYMAANPDLILVFSSIGYDATNNVNTALLFFK